MDTTGLRIRQIRIGKGIGQEELALMIGRKSASYISRLERGERRIDSKTIQAIAKALEVAPSSLLKEPSDFIPVDPKFEDLLVFLPALKKADPVTLNNIRAMLGMNPKKKESASDSSKAVG